MLYKPSKIFESTSWFLRTSCCVVPPTQQPLFLEESSPFCLRTPPPERSTKKTTREKPSNSLVERHFVMAVCVIMTLLCAARILQFGNPSSGVHAKPVMGRPGDLEAAVVAKLLLLYYNRILHRCKLQTLLILHHCILYQHINSIPYTCIMHVESCIIM